MSAFLTELHVRVYALHQYRSAACERNPRVSSNQVLLVIL
jgi:hypothetical protein